MARGGPWHLRFRGDDHVVHCDTNGHPQGNAGLLAARLAEMLHERDPALRGVLQDIYEVLRGPSERSDDMLRTNGPGLHREIVPTLLAALEQGILQVRVVARPPISLSLPVAEDMAELGSEDEPPADETTTWFELRVVDEVGEAIGELPVHVFSDGTLLPLRTDSSGKVRVDGADTSFATARVADVQALRELVEPRWQQAREGRAPGPEQPHVTHMELRDDIGEVALEREKPHTLVITPPRGKLFVELYDKAGRSRHAERSYRIEGPVALSGTTDAIGRLLHPDVPPGDYTLTLTLAGDDYTDEPRCAVIVLPADDPEPQIRMIGALPYASMVRVRGALFDTSKCFLLPTALPSLERIRDVYEAQDPGELLVVGHTDTAGQPSFNDPLSLDRAAALAAYLGDDVDAWLEHYNSSSSSAQWGAPEDLAMIGAVTDMTAKPASTSPVKWYQEQHNAQVEREGSGRPVLDTDGVAGPKTRRELVTDYMLADGTSLAPDGPLAGAFDIVITTHGCGENFPVDDSGEALDSAPADAKPDQLDRRAELFFFDRDFGIRPPPPGKNSRPGSTEYPAWREHAERIDDLWAGPHVLAGRLVYANGRPAAGVPFVIRVGEQVVDGGYTDDDGRYRIEGLPSATAELRLCDRLLVVKNEADPAADVVAVTARPSPAGTAVA